MSSTQPEPIVIPPELEAEMTPAVRAFVDMLIDRIAKLEARLGANPQNSSLPPSTQHQRELIATEDCDAVVPLKPTTCRRCATALTGSDPQPLRHQVWELPEI